ncbi:LapA family protein [Spiribacter insolitus]|uniref:LapA family protein n=1 Tax=Spiribacter insolitus TaxID=3122417 RepID=A0ABV3TA13_9GAMM
MKRLIGLIFALIVVAAGLSFAMLNPTPVALDFYLGQLKLPVALWLVIAFTIGVIIGLAAATGILMRQRWQLTRLRREVAASREELSELRKLPIRNTP